jgi:hypothetical protein
MSLFSKLRACNFSTIRTTRLYKEFLKELTDIKNRFFIKLKWNTLLAAMVKDMLCLA